MSDDDSAQPIAGRALEELRADADYGRGLQRAAYEPGTIYSVATARGEQRYHRLRLNRHQLLLHGWGTVGGLAVRLEAPAGWTTPPASDTSSSAAMTLVIEAGLAIDRLGRELALDEAHELPLRNWVDAYPELLTAATASGRATLAVTIAHEPSFHGPTPVASQAWINAGLDAVAPARLGDGCILELLPYADYLAALGEDAGWRSVDLNRLHSHERGATRPTDFGLAARARQIFGWRSPLAVEPASQDTTIERSRWLRRSRVLLATLAIPAPTGSEPWLLRPETLQLDNFQRPLVELPPRWRNDP